jgi:hypothetical protein
MVSSDTSRSTRRRCSPARDGTWTRGTALKVPGESSVRMAGRPASSPATSCSSPAERRTRLRPQDVEAALEPPPQVGDVGLLGLGLLAAGAQLRQAELADLLGEARVEDPVDAALAARHYLHAHPSPRSRLMAWSADDCEGFS